MNATVNIEVSEETIRSLLTSAFEDGSDYWMFIKEYCFPPNTKREDFMFDEKGKFALNEYWPIYSILPFHKDGEIVIEDKEEEGITHTLTREKLEEGMRIMSKKYPHHFTNVMTENYDCETADVFLQLCLFGEIVYS